MLTLSFINVKQDYNYSMWQNIRKKLLKIHNITLKKINETRKLNLKKKKYIINNSRQENAWIN